MQISNQDGEILYLNSVHSLLSPIKDIQHHLNNIRFDLVNPVNAELTAVEETLKKFEQNVKSWLQLVRSGSVPVVTKFRFERLSPKRATGRKKRPFAKG